MSMRAPSCPRHAKKGGTLEDCPWCEAEIELHERAEQEPDPERSDVEAARYEQWLDRCFEG